MTALTFGYEFEVAGNGHAVLDVLHRTGAVANDYLCEYHGCGYDCCDHENEEWLFSAQEDCTVSAEFPSKVLTWGTERAERAFTAMEFAAVSAGADLSGDSGMHVHVVKPPTESVLRTEDGDGVPVNYTTRQRATWRLLRIFARYQGELADIAAGGRDYVREYNHPLKVNDTRRFWCTDLTAAPAASRYGRLDGSSFVGGTYLDTQRHTDTYEFRLWNAAKAAWRQRLCVAFSVAMVEASMAGVDVTENDPRPVEEVLAPWLDNHTWAGILRQRFGKGGITAEGE